MKSDAPFPSASYQIKAPQKKNKQKKRKERKKRSIYGAPYLCTACLKSVAAWLCLSSEFMDSELRTLSYF